MKKIHLIIENAKDGVCWGRVNYEDDLLVDNAESVEQLQIKMKDLLVAFHDLEASTLEFDISYDLS